MKSIKKSYKKVIMALLCLYTVGAVFQSCTKEDNDFKLSSFGPSEVERGGYISFIGKNLDKVQEIILPDGSVFSKGQFELESSGKISLQIPADYPFYAAGKIILKLSGGSQFETVSNFKVLSSASVTKVDPTGTSESPLNPEDLITITGKALETVKAIIFNNGEMLESFESQNDQQIQFKLPEKASSGTLKIMASAWEGDTTYFETSEIFVLEPILTTINGEAYPEDLPVGSQITISGKNFSRIDLDENGLVDLTFTGAVMAKGTIDGDNITVTSWPLALQVGKPLTVTVSSNGKSVPSIATFSVAAPTFECGPTWDGNYVTINGTNLSSIELVYVVDPEAEGGRSTKRTIVELSSTTLRVNLGSKYKNTTLPLELELYSGQTYIFDKWTCD